MRWRIVPHLQLALLATGTNGPARELTGDPFRFPLALEIGVAAVIVIGLWRLINDEDARFWAWRPRGWGSALAVALKMLGLYLFAAVLTAILPILTHVFDVHAESALGAGFLVAEAAAAGLASMTFAGRKASARQEAAERGEESIAGWLERALTACFMSLAETARAGVRGRLAEALASDEHRLRLLGALRDFAKDAGEGDASPTMAAVLFMSNWPDLQPDERATSTDTVRDFVVERRMARRRLVPRRSRPR
jgi:hypothetical protein